MINYIDAVQKVGLGERTLIDETLETLFTQLLEFKHMLDQRRINYDLLQLSLRPPSNLKYAEFLMEQLMSLEHQ